MEYKTDKITVEDFVRLLNCYPNDMLISAYVESIDSVVDINGIEEHEGELNIRINY